MADGLGEPLFNPPGSKVDVAFVDGFYSGHSGPPDVSSTTVWPEELLAQAGTTARVFRFGYLARFSDFFPRPNHTGTSIDDHSANLLRVLEGIAQTGDRPIILAARDLGGLVCANALSKQDANAAVVNNIRGLAFFETPFEGNMAAGWAKAAKELPILDGLKMPRDLKERSWKLIRVNNEFLEFLKPRNEHLQIRSFYKTYKSSPLLSEGELVEVTSENWDEISSQLAQWIKEFGTPPAKPEEFPLPPLPPGYRYGGDSDTNYCKENSRNLGAMARGDSVLRVPFPTQGSSEPVDNSSKSLMDAISTKIRLAAEDQFPRAMFRTNWDIQRFVDEQFDDPAKVKIGTALSITGGRRDAQMTTVELYIKQTWPEFPSCLLETLQEALDKKGRVKKRFPENEDVGNDDTTQPHQSGPGLAQIWPPFLMHDANETVPTIEVSFTADGMLVEVNGPANLLIAIAQQLAWLGSTCRASPFEGALACCRSTLERRSSDSLKFEISYQLTIFKADKEASCWTSLLSSSVIAIGFPIPERKHGEMGLQIPLDVMATLGDVSIAIDDGAGFVLKGHTFGFYPSSKLGNDSVQWHLIHKKGNPVNFEDFPQSRETLCEDELYTTKVFLGWTPKVHNFLGTAPLPKTDSHSLDESYRICYSGIQPSGGSNLRRSKWSWSGITAGVSKFISLGTNFTRSKREDPPPPHPPPKDYEAILSWLAKVNVVLYDTLTKRAWFSDAERLALQVIVHCNELEKNSVRLSKPDPGSPEALRTVMTENREIVLKKDYDVDESKATKTTFMKVVKEISEKISYLMEQSTKEETTQASATGSKEIIGWEYMDVVNKAPSPNMSTVTLKDGCGDWPDLIKQLRAVVLLGSNFQEVFRPAETPDCLNFRTVPGLHSYLSMEMATLCRLVRDRTPEEGPIRLTKSGLAWQISGNPFGSCGSTKSPVCTCDRIQKLSRAPDSPSNPEQWRSGAIIFGSHKLQKKERPLPPRR